MTTDTDETVLCLCMWLTRDEIIETIPLVHNLKELKERTGACTVCFGCEADLDDVVAEHRRLFGTAPAV